MTLLRRPLHALRVLGVLLRRSVAKGWNDRLLGLSAETAFWQMLSLPSLALALIASLGYVSRLLGDGTVNRTEAKLEAGLSHAFSPQVVSDIIAPTLNQILRGDRADIVSIGFLLALWAGSSAMATFVNTVTIAYGQRDLRGAVKSRFLALGLFLATVLFGVLLLPMLVLGPDLIDRASPKAARHTVSQLVSVGYYPVLVLMLMLGLTTFYKLAPPKRLPWRRGLPGALLALVIFLGGSEALRGYIGYILDKNHAYATLAAPIAALLFFYVLALGVLLGAEFNAVIELHRPAKVRLHHPLDLRHWRLFRVDKAPHTNGPHTNGTSPARTNGNGSAARDAVHDLGRPAGQDDQPRIRP